MPYTDEEFRQALLHAAARVDTRPADSAAVAGAVRSHVMHRRVRRVALACAGLAALTASAVVVPQLLEQPGVILNPGPPGVLPSATASTPAGAPTPNGFPADARARAIAYVAAGDLWIWEPNGAEPGGRVRQVTSGGDISPAVAPQWVGPHEVWLVRGDTYDGEAILSAVDVRSGEVLDRLTVDQGMQAFALHPNGYQLASIEQGYSRLSLRDLRSGERRDGLHRQILGRGGDGHDEVAVRWSLDGEMLLVVNTPAASSGETIFVVDDRGDPVTEPRFGSHARWSRDATEVLYWGPFETDSDNAQRWRAFDPRTGAERVIERTFEGGTAPATRPALSPDGTRLAYDSGAWNTPTGWRSFVTILDLRTGEKKVGWSGRGAPVWLDNQTLAVTSIRSCVASGEDCEGESYGDTIIISLDGRDTVGSSLPTTLNVAVHYA